MEPGRAPVPGLGVVGEVHADTTIRAAARTRSKRRGRSRRTNATKHPPGSPGTPIYAWTDLTYLLHKQKVSWGYYVVSGTEPDCANDSALSCIPGQQNAKTPGIWNPLPYFDTVSNDEQLGNIQSVESFYKAAAERHAARGVVGGPVGPGERAPAVVGERRAVVRDEPRERGDAQPGLELDRDLPGVGRLGRPLRPRGAARRRPERLRPARAGHRDQPVRQARLHRSSDPELRRVRRSSSKTTSSAVGASIPRPTAGPTRDPTFARTRGSSAT